MPRQNPLTHTEHSCETDMSAANSVDHLTIREHRCESPEDLWVWDRAPLQSAATNESLIEVSTSLD